MWNPKSSQNLPQMQVVLLSTARASALADIFCEEKVFSLK
jgi:hypothetical protein